MNIVDATCRNLAQRMDEIGAPDTILRSAHFSRAFFIDRKCHCFQTGPSWESSTFLEEKQAVELKEAK